MFKFEKEQTVLDFNGYKIGGQPGEYPRALGASIFYNKHETVLNEHTGEIDKPRAEALCTAVLNSMMRQATGTSVRSLQSMERHLRATLTGLLRWMTSFHS